MLIAPEIRIGMRIKQNTIRGETQLNGVNRYINTKHIAKHNK